MKKIATTILLLSCIILKAQTASDSLLTKNLIKPNNSIFEKWLDSHSAGTLDQIRQIIYLEKQSSFTTLNNKFTSDKNNISTSKGKRKIKQVQLELIENNFAEELKSHEQYYDALPIKINSYMIACENYKKDYAKQERAILEQNRVEERKIAAIQQHKKDSTYHIEYELQVKKANDEWNAIPKSSAYINWKSKYENYIKSGKTNVSVCETIKNKHSFKNRWGERLVDIDAFPKVDKVTYNKNRNAIQIKINAINDLIYNDKTFYNYYNASASNEQIVGLYKLQQFLNENSNSY